MLTVLCIIAMTLVMTIVTEVRFRLRIRHHRKMAFIVYNVCLFAMAFGIGLMQSNMWAAFWVAFCATVIAWFVSGVLMALRFGITGKELFDYVFQPDNADIIVSEGFKRQGR